MTYRRSAQMQERLAGHRARIIRAARKLIARGGFRAAQMSAVADTAELSTGALYRFFPSKAQLFIEVLTDAVTHEIQILQQITTGGGSARARLEQAVTSFAERALAGRNLAYAFIVEPIDVEIDSVRLECRRRFAEVFEQLLRDGIRNDEFPAQDAAVVAACLVGAFTEALTGSIVPTKRSVRAQREQLVRTIRRFCLQAVIMREVRSD